MLVLAGNVANCFTFLAAACRKSSMEATPLIEPSEFDLVVIGTGLTESIVAAAAAKAGHSVLQLDPSDHYGGACSSLHLDELAGLLHGAGANAGAATQAASQQGQQADVQPAPAGSQQQHWHEAPLAPPSTAAAAGIRGAQVWRRPDADLGPPRQYCLDLAPKVAYGWGPVIQLLLGSGAHNYVEFKLVQGSYLLDGPASRGGGVAAPAAPVLRSVPSSRSEVFKDRQLSPVQKRSLMRFLKAAAEALEGAGPLKDAFGAQPIQELLAEQGLDAQLQQSLLHGVLLSDTCPPSSGGVGGSGAGNEASGTGGSLSAADALERLRMFVQSAGRYGSGTGPFLTPLYGCGELPQAFSRTAAVAGAVQVLRCGIAGLSFDEHTCSCDGVELASGQTIRCQQLAANACALADWLETFHPATATCSTHRCCAVLDGPLVPGEQHSMVAVLPSAVAAPAGAERSGSSSSGQVVRALALSSSTSVCPPGKHLLYLWAEPGDGCSGSSSSWGKAGAADALLPALAALADTSALQVQDSCSGTSGAATAAVDEEPAEAGELGGSTSSSDGGKPAALWAAFYTQDSLQMVAAQQQAGSSGGCWPSNVVLCPGPDSSVTFASAVDVAKRCYAQLFPPAAAAAEGAGAALFPLDPGQLHEEAEAEEAGTTGGEARTAAADADSDDEALAALQAALQAARLGTADAAAAAAEQAQGRRGQGAAPSEK